MMEGMKNLLPLAAAVLAAAVLAGEAHASPRFAPGQLLVKFEDGAPAAAVDAALARAGARSGRRLQNGTQLLLVEPARVGAALASLRASAAVEYAERDAVVAQLGTVPNDPLWADQWGLALVGAPAAWDMTRGSANVVVALLDTGVDAAHPELAGAFVSGYDVWNGDADPADDNGHGTSAAGVLAARGDNRQGVAGMCWSCSVMAVKVLGADGSGTMGSVAAGIVWAADHGAHVISLSLGGTTSTRTLEDAVAYAVAKGVVLVAAAGNSNSTTAFYPAAYPKVLSVAATTSSDTRYSWSNYGSWVDLAAPGCNAAPALAGGYQGFCGTSSATPLVAGLAALALSAKPAAKAADVERALTETAVPLGGVVAHGRIDAPRALAAVGAARSSACTIVGTRGNDVLRGTSGADVICGRGGADRLYGRGGRDVLLGGRGADVIDGGRGRDTCRSGRKTSC
jgi:subtilisin family serine protease